MKRPSRRLRESATTTLKNGRFLAPPRASRITTIGLPFKELGLKNRQFYAKFWNKRKKHYLSHTGQHALHAPHHLRHAALGHHFHHFLGLLELAEQAVHLLHLHPGAGGDTALARRLEERRIAALSR